jgi:4a-hydroxytetrahydrobiopterin dehydratase
MTEALASKTCISLSRGEYPHSRASTLSSLTHRPPDWQLAEEAHRIGRSVRFRVFREALTFLPKMRELTRF